MGKQLMDGVSERVRRGEKRETREAGSGCRRSHRGGDPLASAIDLVFVGVQGLGCVQVVPQVLHSLFHGLQLTWVRCGSPHQGSLQGEGDTIML